VAGIHGKVSSEQLETFTQVFGDGSTTFDYGYGGSDDDDDDDDDDRTFDATGNRSTVGGRSTLAALSDAPKRRKCVSRCPCSMCVVRSYAHSGVSCLVRAS
jgi:hypothetical protein